MNSKVNIKGSIRQRLMIFLVGGALILSLGLFQAFQRLAIQLAEESQDNILRASATAILDSASIVNGEIDLDLPYSAFSMLSNVSNDRVFYAIRANDDFLTGYEDLPARATTELDEPVYLTAPYKGETVRLVQIARVMTPKDDPIQLSIALAQTQDGQSQLIERVLRMAAWVGVGVFALVVVLSIITTRATVDPLVRLAESVGRRGPNELRAVSAPVPVEMAPLVSSLNSFMDRLSNSLSRTEEFIADAAHRLRTPLAVVRTRAETTLLRVEKEENRQALKVMIRAIDESSRTAGQMLDHAMVTLRTDSLVKTDINLNNTIEELVERMTPTAELRDVGISVESEDSVSISGDPVLVQSALRNVLDNALKFSSAESLISLNIGEEAHQAYVCICDEGQGFPDQDLEALVVRFARGKNSEGVVGSGLGLTIASDVVKAHGGRIEIKNREMSGACVTLYFSLA